MVKSLNIADDHPLSIELSTLRATLEKYRDEAHSAALKLQHYVQSTSTLRQRIASLDKENVLLRNEVDVLRDIELEDLAALPQLADHPELSTPSRQLLTMMHSLSDSLAYAEHHRNIAQSNMEKAYELASRSRAAEEEAKERERNAEEKWRRESEERRLMELVVGEYAALVRAMERRQSIDKGSPAQSNLDLNGGQSEAAPTAPPFNQLMDSLTAGKSGISRLFSEFSSEVSQLEKEIATIKMERDVLASQLEAEKSAAEIDRNELAKCRIELAKQKEEAEVRRRGVELYMQFSQNTLSALQTTLSSLTTRHSATLTTISNQVASLRSDLDAAELREIRLRGALDEVSADLARESLGRRTEIRMRIAGMVRDEKNIVPTDEAIEDERLARLLAAESAVSMLLGELEQETTRRIQLERAIALQDWKFDSSLEPGHADADAQREGKHNSNSATTSNTDKPLPIIEVQSKPSPPSSPPNNELPTDSPPATSPLTAPSSVVPLEPLSSHPDLVHLFSPLHDLKSQYETLQGSFNERRRSLQDIRTRMNTPTDPPSGTSDPEMQVIHVAMDRIYDYMEDALVELEIRLSDGEVRNTGFKAILDDNVSIDSLADGSLQQLQNQITIFVQAEEIVLHRLTKKLDDVLHDINAILAAERRRQDTKNHTPPNPSPTPSLSHTRSHSTLRPQKESGQSMNRADGQWSSWIHRSPTPSTIERTRERTSSMTFGSVMTSPRPRARRELSDHDDEKSYGHRRTPTFERDVNGLGSGQELGHEALSMLDLRIPMPSVDVYQASNKPNWPLRPRQRVVSQGVYALGLGSRQNGSSLAFPRTPSISSASQPRVVENQEQKQDIGLDTDTDADAETEDSEIE